MIELTTARNRTVSPPRTGVAHGVRALQGERQERQRRHGHGELDGGRPPRVGGVPDPPLPQGAETQRDRAEDAQRHRTRAARLVDVGAQDDHHPGHPDRQADHLPRRQPLPEEGGGQDGGEHRGEGVQQRGEGGAETGVEGEVHRAELDGVHGQPGEGDPAQVRAVDAQRPAEQPRHDQGDRGGEGEPQGEQREGRDVLHAVRAGDVARRPHQDEGDGRDQRQGPDRSAGGPLRRDGHPVRRRISHRRVA